jgi:hypothetical protein
MAGGLMQLVAYGAQDIYLTGNPQITFFKVVYRRHTNFAVEAVEQTLNGTANFGQRVTCIISRNGDLVGRTYLECDLAFTADTNIYANPGSAMIDNVEVQIGGQMIDKHYGKWLEVYALLTEENVAGTTQTLTDAASSLHASGTKYQNMACHAGVAGQSGTSVAGIEKFFVPLKFWFNRNPGLYLPLIALQYHEVKLLITFAARADVAAAAATSFGVKVWCDYIYLDTDERRRFAQVSHEYLIEQVQTQDFSSSNSFTLTFNHPVKELIWAGFTATATDVAGPTTPLATAVVTGANWKLVLNGQDRFYERDYRYFTRVQVHQHHTGYGAVVPGTAGLTDAIAVYSFALKPEEHQPTGTCNFSRIDTAQLKCTTATGVSMTVFAVNYNVLRLMSGMGGLAYSN